MQGAHFVVFDRHEHSFPRKERESDKATLPRYSIPHDHYGSKTSVGGEPSQTKGNADLMRWCRFGTDFFVCDCEKLKMYWMYIEFFGKKQAGKDVPKMCHRINQRFPRSCAPFSPRMLSFSSPVSGRERIRWICSFWSLQGLSVPNRIRLAPWARISVTI